MPESLLGSAANELRGRGYPSALYANYTLALLWGIYVSNQWVCMSILFSLRQHSVSCFFFLILNRRYWLGLLKHRYFLSDGLDTFWTICTPFPRVWGPSIRSPRLPVSAQLSTACWPDMASAWLLLSLACLWAVQQIRKGRLIGTFEKTLFVCECPSHKILSLMRKSSKYYSHWLRYLEHGFSGDGNGDRFSWAPSLPTIPWLRGGF